MKRKGAMVFARPWSLRFAVLAGALVVGLGYASAASYPSQPVHIVVPQAAGSSSDIVARLVAQWLQNHLAQPFVVDDRPGLGGSIATEAVVRSAPDGYTLLLVNTQNAISGAIYGNLSYNFVRDIAPVARINSLPLVMEVNPSVPAKTVPEFIAYAKVHPGTINMASAGVGGPQHVAGALFKTMAGIDMVHMPYSGTTPAVADLVAGQVQVMFDVTPTALPPIRSGKLRALAVTTAKRLEVLPDVPAVAEFLPGYEAVAWIGIGAPAGTPAEIVDTLNKQINAALADSAVRSRLGELGAIVVSGPPSDFAQFIAAETDKWGQVVLDAHIRAN
jgi:tripartite-type tricarboxylate transporter receptor subunit TctC